MDSFEYASGISIRNLSHVSEWTFVFGQLACVQKGRCGIYGMNCPEWFTTMEVHLFQYLLHAGSQNVGFIHVSIDVFHNIYCILIDSDC